ncbi:hypothetical protein LRH25_08340 [Ideonella azotifigens]|uniref:Uncharacterized protein n=1 Tax=Ideonella azotifigens TaxID=513160 RepID=A0ABP3VUK6_9BURK|nr:hypothetical protein [Ideonella azotifigens]MCD2340351.1 hypothetical protein [Ideonella azotifigens]
MKTRISSLANALLDSLGSGLLLMAAVMTFSLLAGLVQVAEAQRQGSQLADAQLPEAAAAVPALFLDDAPEAPASAVPPPGKPLST